MGIPGLDHILTGGLHRSRIYLIEGSPGTGKTTLGMQFLLEGARHGERGLYITLSETLQELEEAATSHGWDISPVNVREMITTADDRLAPESQYTVFDPSEVELGETLRGIFEEIERVQPSRVVFDSLSELRLIAQNGLRYRRQILALKHFFSGRGCTVLLLDDRTNVQGDEHVQSLAHGVLQLEVLPAEFGIDRRRMRIAKLRAVNYRSGYHDYRVITGGLEVYPRLVAAEHGESLRSEQLSSGLPELDTLLGGGLRRGTSTLLLGPAGTGKSTLVSQYASAAAKRGEIASMYIFEESLATYRFRAKCLGFDFENAEKSGLIRMKQIDPAELSPGEFVTRVQTAVDHEGSSIIIIDSLNGFLNAMAGERQLLLQLHELLSYLSNKNVTTLLTESQHGMMGSNMGTPIDVSYLADTVMLLRYFEAFGAVHQAISIIKNRAGGHERSIREFGIGPGVKVGEPLQDFHGILTGVPTYHGQAGPLIGKGNGSRDQAN